MKDPILEHFALWLHRFMLFIVLSLLLSIALWLWVLLFQFNLDRDVLTSWLRSALYPNRSSKLPAVVLFGSLTIGFLSTTVIYLVVGKWWKNRGDVHQRGSRFDKRSM